MPSIFESRDMHPGLDSELDAIYAGIEETPELTSSGLGAVVAEQLAQTTPDVHLSPEAIDFRDQLLEPQLEATASAFNTVIETLGLPSHILTETTPELLRTELDEWLTDSKLDYVRGAMEADPDLSFTLVATPNIVVSSNELFTVAEAFGEDQPYPTWIYDNEMSGNLYGSYTSQELSGANPDNIKTVQFSLIPSRPAPELNNQTAQQQQDTLAQLQTTNPDLKVPSVLEAITYWQTLRAQGYKLDGTDDIVNLTLIRHFDLPSKDVDGWSLVPSSYVSDDGRPGLYYSYAEDGDGGRFSVG